MTETDTKNNLVDGDDRTPQFYSVMDAIQLNLELDNLRDRLAANRSWRFGLFGLFPTRADALLHTLARAVVNLDDRLKSIQRDMTLEREAAGPAKPDPEAEEARTRIEEQFTSLSGLSADHAAKLFPPSWFEDLAIALMGEDDASQQAFLALMPKDTGEELLALKGTLGAVCLIDVEAARARIVMVAHAMAEGGDIVWSGTNGVDTDAT